MSPDTWHQAFRFQFLLQEPEHLFLHIHGNNPAGFTAPFSKFAGKKSRSAPEIEDAITGFYILLREAVGAVEEPANAGVEVPRMRCREHTVMAFMIPGTGR